MTAKLHIFPYIRNIIFSNLYFNITLNFNLVLVYFIKLFY